MEILNLIHDANKQIEGLNERIRRVSPEMKNYEALCRQEEVNININLYFKY